MWIIGLWGKKLLQTFFSNDIFFKWLRFLSFTVINYCNAVIEEFSNFIMNFTSLLWGKALKISHGRVITLSSIVIWHKWRRYFWYIRDHTNIWNENRQGRGSANFYSPVVIYHLRILLKMLLSIIKYILFSREHAVVYVRDIYVRY